MHLHIHSKKNPAGDLLNLKVGHKLLGSEVSENTRELPRQRRASEKHLSKHSAMTRSSVSPLDQE